MSSAGIGKPITANAIRKKKGDVPIVCLTAYTTPMANIADEFCDLLLVGDSVGMVLHGLPSTLEVSLEMMIMLPRLYAGEPSTHYWLSICPLEHMRLILNRHLQMLPGLLPKQAAML